MKQEQEYLRDLIRVMAGKTDVTDDFGTALFATPGLAIQDISQFNLETASLVGPSATFTGSMRDTTNYNWAGAKCNVSGGQAGSLSMDESSAASGANIYQVATQAVAAEPATHGSPGSAAVTSFGARITPTKSLLRFIRFVYVNGASAQTGTFEIQSALSPLN